MKERPILFSTAMVLALLDGRKVQTRRLRDLEEINLDREIDWNYIGNSKELDLPRPAEKNQGHRTWYFFQPKNSNGRTWAVKCPFGEIGDILYVRESWAARQCNTSTGEVKIEYAATPGQLFKFILTKSVMMLSTPMGQKKKWKPNLHMLKQTSRLFLKITNIRLERLQDITQEDAKAEGVYTAPHRPSNCGMKLHSSITVGDCFICAFKMLWNLLNGKKGFSWNNNPWIWVIEFEVQHNQLKK